MYCWWRDCFLGSIPVVNLVSGGTDEFAKLSWLALKFEIQGLLFVLIDF